VDQGEPDQTTLLREITLAGYERTLDGASGRNRYRRTPPVGQRPPPSWMVGPGGYPFRMLALTRSISSGVTSRIPCSLACSEAFLRTSSSVSPRTTCPQPLDGSTLAHSSILPMGHLLLPVNDLTG